MLKLNGAFYVCISAAPSQQAEAEIASSHLNRAA